MLDQIAFVDTETTGLDPDLHQIWEVALIVGDEEKVWQLPVDLGRADPMALKISGYRQRAHAGVTHLSAFAHEFERLTRYKHLCGAVVSFDEERLRKLLRANGSCPSWHYHIIDIEAMVVGFLARHGEYVELPWKSDDLGLAVGVAPPTDDARHTALGDARWARDIFLGMIDVEARDAV